MRTVGRFVVLMVVVAIASPVLAQQTLNLDCRTAEGPNALQATLDIADPGATINIIGTCTGTAATITQDDLALVGEQDAILEGIGPDEDVIEINGAHRVVIQGVMVRGGDSGIRALGGATVRLDNVVAEGNADDGVTISTTSVALIRNCTAQDNGDDGFAVALTASALFTGAITSTGNADDGLAVVLGSSAEIFDGAVVLLSNNGLSATFGSEMFEELIVGDGLHVTTSSQLFIIDSTVEIMGNANDGILVSSSSSLLASAPANRAPVAITVAGNGDRSGAVGAGGDGVQVTGLSSFFAQGSNLTLTIQDNARRAFNVFDSLVNLFRANVVCSERPQDPPAAPTCPTP